MNKSILVISAFLLISFSAIAQNEFFIGSWKFEKIPDHVGMDDQKRAMGTKMFGEMNLSFDEKNYSLTMMGMTDEGTWQSLDGNIYELTSSAGTTQVVAINKLSDDHIIFIMRKGEIQMKRSGVNSTASETIEVALDDFIIGGQWVYDKVPDDKELSKKEQDMATGLFEKTTLSFISKEKYATTNGKMSDKGTWKILDENALELTSSSGMKQKLGIKKLSDSQIIITFNETIDIVMKKNGK